MNTLTSVVLLSLLVAFSQGKTERKNITVEWGKDVILVGPQDLPVNWHGPRNELCKGTETLYKQLSHKCDGQNLTLIRVNNTFQGTYYGFRKDETGMNQYTVKVYAPKAYTRKALPKTIQYNVYKGQNITLTGPPYDHVDWYGPTHQLCNGDETLHPEINHTCTKQNLTLTFVNSTYWGAYYGINKDGNDRTSYEVTVLDGYENAGQHKDEDPEIENSREQTKPKTKSRSTQKTNKHRPDKQPKKDIEKDFASGTNQTLVGPPGSKTDWYNGKLDKLCGGKTGLKILCNDQNITLINVNETYAGTYYGSNENDHRQYRVTVYTKPRNETVKIQPYTTKGITKSTLGNHSFELQLGNGESEDDQKQIPSATVAIVVGVIAGFITLIIVILCYICCRKRPRAYNHMVDPLLSFSY